MSPPAPDRKRPSPRARGGGSSSEETGLGAPLQGLPGVGPRTAERLAAEGLRTRADAIALVPRRWDDLRTVTPPGALREGEPQTTQAVVRTSRIVFGRKRFFE